MDGMDNDLLIRPNARTLTLREVMQKIARFIEMLPTVEFVILVRRKGDGFDKIACCRGGNTDKSVVREMLRASLQAYDTNNVSIDRA